MRALILAIALAACTEQASTWPPEESASQTDATPSSTETSALAQMPTWEAARTQGVDFRGVGQEPGWIVDIYTQGRIVALLDYGETLIEFPRNAPTEPAEGVTRYETQSANHSLTITISRAPCADAMSGEPYPARVDLVVDGRTLSGCGRSA